MSAESSGIYMTADIAGKYIQTKLDSGVAPTAAAKYKNAINHLLEWMGEDRFLTAERARQWRRSLENSGYSKVTIQRYVATINTFLRSIGYEELGIPKPPRNDLTGKTFGYLTAIEAIGKSERKNVIWRCRCRCGKEVDVAATLLSTMNTTSCGCLKTEKIQYSQRYIDNTSLTASLKNNPISERAVSGYTGVQPKRDKWTAYIQYKGVQYNLGTYSKIEDAVKARAHAKALVMDDAQQLYEESIDFFGDMPVRPPKPKRHKVAEAKKDIATKAKRNDNTSGYTGVKLSYGKWSADITYQKRRYFLGAYDDIEDAIKVRKLAEKYAAEGNIESLKKISTGSTSTERHHVG